jgi:hypothetical protein
MTSKQEMLKEEYQGLNAVEIIKKVTEKSGKSVDYFGETEQ